MPVHLHPIPEAPPANLTTISFAALTSSDAAVVSAEVERVIQACETSGFFCIVDHGVPASLLRRTINASRNFFGLPEDVKQKYGQDKHRVVPATCRGYGSAEMLNMIHGYDYKQFFDMGLEREHVEGKPFYGPNISPSDEDAPDFSKSMFELQDHVVNRLAPVIRRTLAKGLGLDEHFFDYAMQEPTLIQRALCYPAMAGSAGKHTDSGLFTVLIQESSPERSLQVFTGGRWMSVRAEEEVFVVNLGDTLQFWTNNRFVSTPHQVRHCGDNSRISVPFFFYPDIEAEFVPLKGGPRIRVADVICKNFKNIWEDFQGAGRAKELV